MTIDYTKFPVAVIYDFDGVIVDAQRFDDDSGGHFYTASLNFYTQFADDDTGQRGEGMSFVPGIIGDNLHEIHDKIGMLIATGFFGEVDIQGHGTLWDENYNEIADICWLSYGDGDDGCGLVDDDEDENIDDEIDRALMIEAPRVLQ
jgi:hypothetical protein